VSRSSLLFLLLSSACAPRAHDLPAAAQARLDALTADPSPLGALVYRGEVVTGDGVPFTYERRVRQTDHGAVASHLTRDAEGRAVVLHTARHDETYTVAGFEELHAQRGLVGSLSVDDGVAYEVSVAGASTRHTEPLDAPVHVGPTLFGFARTHWDALLAGETRPLRFAVLDAGRSYRFRLSHHTSDGEEVVLRLVATDPLVRLAVGPMDLVFDSTSRQILRYDGPVPPMRRDGDRLHPIDAVVHYTHHAPYR
jgi:hypothetical protein